MRARVYVCERPINTQEEYCVHIFHTTLRRLDKAAFSHKNSWPTMATDLSEPEAYLRQELNLKV
jgi:hypothetical protein